MALPVETEGQNGSGQPSIARVRDYWLEGNHHSGADRELAEHIIVCAPHLPFLVRAQRGLIRRMVQHLVDQGVKQFLDLGTGVPAPRYIHEIAQELDPECRVVYVDVDRGLVEDGRKILVGNDRAAFVQADIREPEQVLAAAEVEQLIDFEQPVALLLIEVLLHIHDDDEPVRLVRTYIDRLAPGSFVGISHFDEDEELSAGLNMFSRMFGAPPQVTLRKPEELRPYIEGLELTEPGIVPVPLWRPSADEEMDRNPEQVKVHALLARKP